MKTAEAQIVTGKVGFFHDQKGWGFLIRDGQTLADVFVHFSAIQGDQKRKTLERNQRVRFELLENVIGPRASRVWVVDDSVEMCEKPGEAASC